MTKTPAPAKPAKAAKPTPEKAAADGPKKRPRLKLALMVLAPLLLAGGGYAGWMLFSGNGAGDADAATEGESGQDKDAMHVSAVPTEIAAETSFTHVFALSVLVASRCGAEDVPALEAASDAEARADGMLATLSWQAAARRAAATTERSCSYLREEVAEAEVRAAGLAGKQAKPALH